MKHYFFSILAFFFSLAAFSQSSETDSLLQILKNAKEDTNKVKTLSTLSFQLINTGEYDNAQEYAEEILPLSQKLWYKKGIADYYRIKGIIFWCKGDYPEALKNSSRALKMQQQLINPEGIAAAYTNIGIIYDSQGNYAEALKSYFHALAFRETLLKKMSEGDKKNNIRQGVATLYNNIGLIHEHQGNFEQALKNHFDALKIEIEIDDKYGIAGSYNNIGDVFGEQKNYSEALKNYLQALKINKEIDNKNWMAINYNNIGKIYEIEKNYSDAINNYFQAQKINEEIGDKQGLANSYNNIGSLYLRQKKYSEAKNYFLKALQFSTEIGYKNGIEENYYGLAELSSVINDFKNAYDYHKKYSETKDSLLNEASSKQITEMQTKYETEKKEQQINLLNKDKELQDAQLNRQKIIIWSVAVGLLMVIILAGFILRERRKSEKLLLNILPVETAKELKANGKASPKYYESVTVMFTDFKGFTTIAEKLSAEELVSELDFIFKKFDEIISKYNIEKIKTIGDAYMCASGLPTPSSNHAEEIVKAGIEIQSWMIEQNNQWQLRMGIHTGPVTAGVVGDKKFAYDIWGDTVNTASRMESSGEAGKINVSGSSHQLIKEKFSCEFRGKIPAKNKGEIEMYFVEKI